MQIDGSAFRRRAHDRIRGRVKVERKLLKRVITIDPPAAYDPAWAADGIKEKPPQGTGEKAWWLRQMIALLPLADWPGLLEIPEGDLFTLARDPDWQEPLLLGWIDSARRLPGCSLPGHLLPFLATREPWPNAALPKHLVLSSLLDAMPPASAVAALDAIAKHLPPMIALDVFARLGQPPPPGTGKALLALLDQSIAAHPSPLVRPQARSLAICIPHDAIQSRLEAIAKLPELSPAAEEFATTLEFRRSLLSCFHN